MFLFNLLFLTKNDYVHKKRVALAWLLRCSCMAPAWLLRGSQVAPAWLLGGSCVASAWLLLGSCVAPAWLLCCSCVTHTWLLRGCCVALVFQGQVLRQMNVNVNKINMFKMNVRTLWSELQSCYAIYILPNCIRNHHIKFEIYRTVISCLNY